jgi:membrane protein
MATMRRGFERPRKRPSVPMPSLRDAWFLLKAAVAGWVADRCASMGAAIAYYAAFSLAPLLILVIAIAGLAFGREAAEGAILGQLQGLIGREGGAALEAMIAGAGDLDASALAGLFGIGALILAATGAVTEIQSSLNVIWRAPPRAESTFWTIVRRRLLSISLVAVMGFLLMTSLVVSAALAAGSDYLGERISGLDVILRVVNFVVSTAVIAVLFGMIFKILPDVPVRWRDVWIGAVVTALLFSLGKSAIGAYVGSSAAASTYGAAAALVIILLWVYYTSQILLFGAELARACAGERTPARR